MVEGARLERVYRGNSIEGSNPSLSATCPRESVLPMRLRPDFTVVIEGYAYRPVHLPQRRTARSRSLTPDVLPTCYLP